jgi:GxxExxY protein
LTSALRVLSPLTPKTEAVVRSVMECAFTVHRSLGPGFLEKIYIRALHLELAEQKLNFEAEKNILVRYKRWQIPGQTVDLIVESSVLIEAKVVPKLRPIHRLQVLSYLKTLDLRIGLLINFNAPVLKDGFKRVIR